MMREFIEGFRDEIPDAGSLGRMAGMACFIGLLWTAGMGVLFLLCAAAFGWPT